MSVHSLCWALDREQPRTGHFSSPRCFKRMLSSACSDPCFGLGRNLPNSTAARKLRSGYLNPKQGLLGRRKVRSSLRGRGNFGSVAGSAPERGSPGGGHHRRSKFWQPGTLNYWGGHLKCLLSGKLPCLSPVEMSPLLMRRVARSLGFLHYFLRNPRCDIRSALHFGPYFFPRSTVYFQCKTEFTPLTELK